MEEKNIAQQWREVQHKNRATGLKSSLSRLEQKNRDIRSYIIYKGKKGQILAPLVKENRKVAWEQT